jgi:hypothetical protein
MQVFSFDKSPRKKKTTTATKFAGFEVIAVGRF